MIKCISKFVDATAVSLFHFKRSKQSQFKDGDTTNYVFSTPICPDIRFQEKENSSGYRSGLYSFNNTSINGLVRTPASGLYYQKEDQESRTHVIVIHGWRMDNMDRLKNLFLDSFMESAYELYFVTLPYHFDRVEDGDFGWRIYGNREYKANARGLWSNC
ncbi:hypothetical protein [Baia soyae]|uniref:Alpha/beta hydrolase family protein n=1 Tax=Baia soyae TaxID=1544746 RepID=A0A4R2SBU7_9BACL|nr:hypothetical protein [Baia soyae]TCP70228.1 hypothetical protein EDD57_10341 [Baia soyae]